MLRQVPQLFQNPIRLKPGWDFVVLILSDLGYPYFFLMFYFLQNESRSEPKLCALAEQKQNAKFEKS